MSFPLERPRVSALAVVLALGLCLPTFAAPTGATAAPVSASQEATTISLESASGPPGANVTVNLTVSGANVSSYQASVSYDPDVVSVASITGADFSDPVTNVNEDDGLLNLTQVELGGAEDPTLARITFTLVGQSTNETALAFDEDATAIFDGDSEEIFVDSYSSGSVLVEQAATPTPSPTATSQPTSSGGGESDSGDSDSGGSTQTTAGGSGDGTDGGDSSFVDSVLNQSFLLGAGFAVLVVAVAGIGYYLGARNSRSRNNW